MTGSENGAYRPSDGEQPIGPDSSSEEQTPEEVMADALEPLFDPYRFTEQGREQTSVAEGFPLVQGKCPACGSTSLFLGAGGHVTCARLDCSDPCAADALLSATAREQT